MLEILQARLQEYVNQELPDVQAGFRKGRGTRDQIVNIEKTRQLQKNFSFIDYAKAFDCVSSVQLLSHVQLFAPHELQQARPPCPSPTPGAHPNPCPLTVLAIDCVANNKSSRDRNTRSLYLPPKKPWGQENKNTHNQ